MFEIPVVSSQELGDAPFLQCPEQWGVQVYPHPTHCDHFYKCENGTLTHETCPNGLLFDGRGSVAHHCNYYWAVDCGERKERGKRKLFIFFLELSAFGYNFNAEL